MHDLAIRKCTSPPPWLREWKFSNENLLFRQGSNPGHAQPEADILPSETMKAHGGYGCKGPHIRSHGTMKRYNWVASPMLGRLYPRESYGTHFIVGWVDPTNSLDTKVWRKISNPLTPGIKLEPSNPQPSVLPLELSSPPLWYYTWAKFLIDQVTGEQNFYTHIMPILQKSRKKTNKKTH